MMAELCVLGLHSEGLQTAHFVPCLIGQEQSELFFSSALSPGGQLVEAFGSKSTSQDMDPTLPLTAPFKIV
jgi:hypothetical protein